MPAVCKKPVSRKIILGLYIIIALLVIAIAITSAVTKFTGGEGSVEKYVTWGINNGMWMSIIILVFTVVSKIDDKYSKIITQQKINELHYMVSRNAFSDSYTDSGNQRFADLYSNMLCETTTKDVSGRYNMLNKFFKMSE